MNVRKPVNRHVRQAVVLLAALVGIAGPAVAVAGNVVLMQDTDVSDLFTSGAGLPGAKLSGAVLAGAGLPGAGLPSDWLSGARLPGSGLAGAPLAAAGRDETRRLVGPVIEQAARLNDVPAPLMTRLLQQESGFSPVVVSRAGALGIAQFMPATARAMGLDDPFDPVSSVSASARYLGLLRRQFGNVGLAAAAYNAGPGRVQQWLAGQAALPAETVNYVRAVTGRAVLDWAPPAIRDGLRLQAPQTVTFLAGAGWEAQLLAQLTRTDSASSTAPVAALAPAARLTKASGRAASRRDRKLLGEAALCAAVSRPGAPCIPASSF